MPPTQAPPLTAATGEWINGVRVNLPQPEINGVKINGVRVIDSEQLGKTDVERQSAYRALFRGRMPERDWVTIREATNKAWALGDDRFKAQIEASAGRRSVSLERGGDRKSVAFREGHNQ